MRPMLIAFMVAAVSVAGCVESEEPETDGIELPDNAVSTDPMNLAAVLNVSATEAVAPYRLVIDYDVDTNFDEVNWTLQLEDKARFTVFHMGSGGLDKLPGQRNMTLEEGTYVVTLDVEAGDATSQAFATVTITLDPNACGTPPEYLVVGAAGEQHYILGDQVWRETTGDDELQTPDSCPEGPHDKRIR